MPGPVRTRAYYAPALVAFVGGNNFQLAIGGGNVGGVAWFPLGPRDVYRPSYAVSRGYFENVNRSNTVVNTTVINNYYNNSNVTNVVYANRQVAGAVVAVPTTTFVQSQPVDRAAVRVTPAMVASAPVAIVPSVAPTEKSVRGAANPGDKPPARVFERPVVARTAPPAASVAFAAQQQQLAATPGKPLDDTARRQLKPVAAAPAPVVKVVSPAQIAPPTARPPPTTFSCQAEVICAENPMSESPVGGPRNGHTYRCVAARTYATHRADSGRSSSSRASGNNCATTGATRYARTARTTRSTAADAAIRRGATPDCPAAGHALATGSAVPGAARQVGTAW